MKNQERRIKMKSIENNEIVWNNQEPPKSVQNVPQVQKIKEPSTAEKNPGRPIDPNISRKVKLKNLEIQSEIEKRSADESLKQAKERELKKRNENYNDKKDDMIREAKQLKHPEVFSPKNNRTNPMEINFREIPLPETQTKNSIEKLNKNENDVIHNKSEIKKAQDRERGRQPLNYTPYTNQSPPI